MSRANRDRIFKYTLTGPYCVVQMPRHSQIIATHEQRGEVCVWAIVTDAPVGPRQFSVLPTGDYAPSMDDAQYIGTVHLEGGALVFHVFAEPDR